MSDDFQAEFRFLGLVASPAFVRQPEGNGSIERFFRTLKEQLLWVRHFPDVEDQQQALRTFKETTNLLPAHWNAASGRVLDDSAATIVPRQPMVLEVGSRLGRYDVTGRIGEGGHTT